MRQNKMNHIRIQTPEGIVFPLLLAGPVTRFLAWLIDFFMILTLLAVSNIVIHVLNPLSVDLARALSMLLYFLISIGYAMSLEWYWRGQTIGKRLFHLRVIDVQGFRLQFHQIVIRNLLRFVDSLPAFYLLGGISCLLSSNAQRLGDIAANTVVIHNLPKRTPDLKQLMAGKYNSFRDYPHLAARLRQRISPQEGGIALEALLRRDQLDPDQRIELFEMLASHFKKSVLFPPELTDGIADEQYVRNVVDILFCPFSKVARKLE